jgi:hypothetical protein
MNRRTVPLRGRRTLHLLAAVSALVLSSTAGQTLEIGPGDLVGVFVKNGYEVVVNLGPASQNMNVDLSGVVDIPQFGGSIADAKFVAMGVQEVGREIDFGEGPVPQENVMFSKASGTPQPTDLQIANAMNALESALPGSGVWFELLRDLDGTSSELISSSSNFSYERRLGLGTDAIANAFTFSIAGTVNDAEQLSVTVYGSERGYEGFGGPAREVTPIAGLQLNGTDVFVPEPHAYLSLLTGAGVLGAISRRRNRNS